MESIKNKTKQNEQNSSRLLNPEEWLVVTMWEGLWWVGEIGEGDRDTESQSRINWPWG